MTCKTFNDCRQQIAPRLPCFAFTRAGSNESSALALQAVCGCGQERGQQFHSLLGRRRPTTAAAGNHSNLTFDRAQLGAYLQPDACFTFLFHLQLSFAQCTGACPVLRRWTLGSLGWCVVCGV